MHNSKGKCIDGHKLHRNCPRLSTQETHHYLMALVFIFFPRQVLFDLFSLLNSSFSMLSMHQDQRSHTEPALQSSQPKASPSQDFSFIFSLPALISQARAQSLIHRELCLYHTYRCVLDSVDRTLCCFTQGWVNRFNSERNVILAGFFTKHLLMKLEQIYLPPKNPLRLAGFCSGFMPTVSFIEEMITSFHLLWPLDTVLLRGCIACYSRSWYSSPMQGSSPAQLPIQSSLITL